MRWASPLPSRVLCITAVIPAKAGFQRGRATGKRPRTLRHPAHRQRHSRGRGNPEKTNHAVVHHCAGETVFYVSLDTRVRGYDGVLHVGMTAGYVRVRWRRSRTPPLRHATIDSSTPSANLTKINLTTHLNPQRMPINETQLNGRIATLLDRMNARWSAYGETHGAFEGNQRQPDILVHQQGGRLVISNSLA